ncbi:hypothetical protein [Chitinolyticbacter albus]|uniref:hypothetical protein n=1 Tax=Chitinolyticbacter albus TaxID=2961951 RepID=UPI00210AE2BE|nr:hypothetical protein [Chitinolyticbacter albus]
MLSRPVIVLLVASLAIMGYYWIQDQQAGDDPVQAAPRRAAGEITRDTAAPAASGASAASVVAASAVLANLFPAQSWAPPPPPTPTPGPPPPTPVPVAPPLPFVVAGSWHDRGVDQIVVEAAGQQFVLCQRCDALGRIQQGETLLGSYRLDSVNRDAIVFTYMPLNQQQTLPVGGTP